MKVIPSGKMAGKPDIREVNGVEVANFTLYAYDANAPSVTREDGTTYKKGIPLKCTAWGDQVDAVRDLKAGDLLTASATVRYNEYTAKDGHKVVEANYVIRRVDPENKIGKQLSALLTGYEMKKYDQIHDNEEVQPEFGNLEQDQVLRPPEKEQVKKQEQEMERE